MILKMRKRFLSHLKSYPKLHTFVVVHFHCTDCILSSCFSNSSLRQYISTAGSLPPHHFPSPPDTLLRHRRFSQKEGVPWEIGVHSSHHSSQAWRPASSLSLQMLAYKSGHVEKLLRFVSESGRPCSALALLATGCREGFG